MKVKRKGKISCFKKVMKYITKIFVIIILKKKKIAEEKITYQKVK